MYKHLLRAAALLAALTLTGCRKTPPLPPGVAPEDKKTRLGESTDLDLTAWLQLPRTGLVKLTAEWTETLQKQTNAIRNNPRTVDLLPKVLPPLAVPVFDKGQSSIDAGFTLPPYVVEGKPDAGVALHLARFGDHEAAVKLAPPGMRSRLDALKTEKNYPVEWTRLVGLALISSQLKLVTGDLDGVSQLVLLHKQLHELLDKKAAEGPLGAVLLSAGKTALERASVAWRDKKRNKTALADDIDKALEEWGKVPAATPMLAFGTPVADVSALFGTAPRGKAIFADTPERVARVVELLGLDLPTDGVQVVAAFLDAKDRLAEWQLAYRSKIDTLYPTPAHIGYRLVESGYTAKQEAKSTNFVVQEYRGGDTLVEVMRTNRSPAMGGHMRIVAAKDGPTPASTRGLRDFGPVHFDRGYETNRLTLVPQQGGKDLTIRDVQAMKKMAKVLDTPVPEVIVLIRDKDADVLSVLEMAWPSNDNAHALDKLLPSLWDDYGPAKVVDTEDQAGSYLSFVWEDKKTRVRLKLAYDDRGPVLAAHDVPATDKGATRFDAARTHDEKERQARIASGKTDERISRSPGRLNELTLAKLKLGQSKSEAEKVLPRGKFYRRKDLPNGVSITIQTVPDRLMPYWARQLLVRYHEGRVAEVRVRYHRGPALVKTGEPLLKSLVDASGAAETIPGSWGGLWTDLAAPGKVVYYRWRDDRTVRTYQRDEGGMEVVLLDRTPESASIVPPTWRFVTDGFANCQLGDTRETVEAYFKTPATSSDDAEVYRTAPSSPYEMIQVWYEGGKVARIRAVHRDRCGATPKEVVAALNTVWGKNIDGLGFIRRQEGASGQVLGAYYWNDDRVRVRTSVRTTDAGPRITTEWCYFPIKADPS